MPVAKGDYNLDPKPCGFLIALQKEDLIFCGTGATTSEQREMHRAFRVTG